MKQKELPEELKKEQAKRLEIAKKMKKSIDAMKKKATAFKKQALMKYKKHIIGILILPPKTPWATVAILIDMEEISP